MWSCTNCDESDVRVRSERDGGRWCIACAARLLPSQRLPGPRVSVARWAKWMSGQERVDALARKHGLK